MRGNKRKREIVTCFFFLGVAMGVVGFVAIGWLFGFFGFVVVFDSGMWLI